MTSRVLSTWNPNALGDGLVLDQGNLVVTTGADALDNSRKVLGTLPKASSVAFFESVFWSTPQVDLGSNIAIGVAKTTSALDVQPGGDADSWGYYPATGDIINNSAGVGSINPIDERTIIGIYLNYFSSALYMNIIIEGSWVASFELDSGFYVPCAMLAGGNAGETSLFSNFGQRGFNYPRIVAPPA